MSRMVLHAPRTLQRGQGTLHTTLCGRMSSQSEDGMNVANSQDEVTCKVCLAKLDRKHLMRVTVSHGSSLVTN